MSRTTSIPAEARTLPWAAFTDGAVFEAEMERIVRRGWQYVGHTSMAAETGRYFTADLGGIPIVVVRDDAGALRALVNVCKHRAFPLAFGEGTTRSLRCGYHGWTYGLDGRLVRAPRSEREGWFDPDCVRLDEVRLELWGPLVFVNADEEAEGLADALGPVPDAIRAAGIEVEELDFHRREHFELAANWKVVCENFLECYHCSVAHPTFRAVIDVSPDTYRLEIGSASVLSQVGALRDEAREAVLAEAVGAGSTAHEAQSHFVWPATMVNVFPGPGNFSIGPVLPKAANRTERYLDYFFAPDVPDAWKEEFVEFDARIVAEDKAIVEAVQGSLASDRAGRGMLLLDSEKLVASFERQVREALEDHAPERVQ
jgi:phenylpropionate dioxygenase-like ring-hydroxylating dioxygenase large terminal subunit